MKKIVVFILFIFILLISLSACEAFSKIFLQETGDSNLDYLMDHSKETVIITGIGTNKNVNLIIPEEIDGYKVTGIMDYAFEGCTFQQISLPKTLEYIGKGVFYNCANLVEVNGFEKTQVSKISDETFKNCSNLEIINISNTVTSIGEYAFASCWYLNIDKLPESLTSIGEHAFDQCYSIETIEIPSSVERIEEFAFFGCINLRGITFNDGLKYIGYRAFCQCTALSSITIPGTVNVVEVEAFYLCSSLSEIDIKNGVKRIKYAAFAGSNVDEVYVPQSVDFLGPQAFYSLSLQSINLDEGNSTYYSQDGAVYTKNDNSIVAYPSGKSDLVFTVPEETTKIDTLVFASSNLETLNIPKSVRMLCHRIIMLSPSLKFINYDGTVEEWESIEKSDDWDMESADYTIYCTDGQIAKDGTVTYK